MKTKITEETFHRTTTVQREVIHPLGCGCTDCIIGQSRPARAGDEATMVDDHGSVIFKVTETTVYYAE